MIVDGLKLNDHAKKKIANTMRETMNFNHRGMFTTYNKSNSSGNLPKLKQRELEKQIKEMKLKKIEKLTKAYVQDYTIFNYKIDSVLNEAYKFVKEHKR